jgi:hypothetical protein
MTRKKKTEIRTQKRRRWKSTIGGKSKGASPPSLQVPVFTTEQNTTQPTSALHYRRRTFTEMSISINGEQ